VKKDKKISKTNGITLVALIITIIVMLILVGVSVQVVINSDLIGTAQDAADRTKTAYLEESTTGSIIEIDDVWYDSMEDYTAGIPSLEQEEANHNWIRTGDILTCKCDNCKEKNSEGISFEIGQEVNYKNRGTGSSALDGEKSGVSQGITDGKLVAADYGTNGEQTITIDSNTTWVVLGIEDKDGNGSNETLLLTTSKPTDDKLTLYGGNPYYYNADEELDRMCKEIYGENARSIDADDVNAVLEFTPEGGIYYPASVGKYLQIGNFTTKVSDLTDDYYNVWNASKQSILYNFSGVKITTWYTPEYQNGTTDENNLGKYVINGYWYLANDEVENPHSLPVPDSTSANIQNLIFGEEEIFSYWIANKGVVTVGVGVVFGIRSSDGNGSPHFR